MAKLDVMIAMYEECIAEVDHVAGGGAGERGTPTESFVRLDNISRRLAVRAVFALIEAVVFNLKNELLDDHGYELVEGERAVCAERSYILSDSGKPRAITAKLSMLANLRFAFDAWARVHRASSFTLDLSGSGWQQLQASKKVRDRLAHPKVPSDLQVTDSEIVGAMDGLDWFHHQLWYLLEAVRASSKKRDEELELRAIAPPPLADAASQKKGLEGE